MRKLRGEQAESDRVGGALPARPEVTSASAGDDGPAAGPGLLLAQTWTNDVDLSGWWMSEKLDGVRAYWDGKQFLSRQGNLFHAPDWFVEKFPPTPLDGELWLARKSFQRTVSIVRRQDKSDLWKELTFIVFDAPAVAGQFEQRQEYLNNCWADHRTPFIGVLQHERCRDLEHLRQELARIESLGGEGLMLREPGSRYEAGRSSTLLKVKRFHEAEATVIEHLPGTGRHKGRLGALAVALPDGTRFSVGTGFSDAQRDNPVAIGNVITFRYQELSDRGVPRFPSFVRVRSDVERMPAADAGDAGKPARATGKPKLAAGTSKPATAKPQLARGKPNSETGKPAQEAKSVSPVDDSPQRRFELVDGDSAKFWEVRVEGANVIVRFGRLGTQGQSQTKLLADAGAAAKHADKLISEKTAKGYREIPPAT